MKRIIAVAGAVLAAIALLGAALVRPGGVAHVYAVDEVMAGLRQHPGAWVGRTVLVWGRDVQFRRPCGMGGAWTMPGSGASSTGAAASCGQVLFERLVPARPIGGSGAGFGPPGAFGGGRWVYGGYGAGVSGSRAQFARAGRFRRGLVVVRQPGSHILTLAPPGGFAAWLASVPVVGEHLPSLLQGGAVYRVRLLNTTRCAARLCPEGQLQ